MIQPPAAPRIVRLRFGSGLFGSGLLPLSRGGRPGAVGASRDRVESLTALAEDPGGTLCLLSHTCETPQQLSCVRFARHQDWSAAWSSAWTAMQSMHRLHRSPSGRPCRAPVLVPREPHARQLLRRLARVRQQAQGAAGIFRKRREAFDPVARRTDGAWTTAA